MIEIQDPENNKIEQENEAQVQSEPASLLEPPFIDWEPNDPENSLNWPPRKKWRMVSIVAGMAAITAFGSSIMAPATPQIMLYFHSSNSELGIFVVSIGVLGYGMGPLVLSPLSEIYGRAPVYHITNLLYVVFAVACAVAPSLSSLIGFRFLIGLAGSAPPSVGGGTISDLFPPTERGKAASLYGLGVLVGPSIGPIIGGPLVQKKGWRWAFWLLSILGAAMFLLTLTFYRETYRPILLRRKLARLQKDQNDTTLKIRTDPRFSFTILRQSIIRPLKLLTHSPSVALVCITSALIFSYYYLLLATFPRVFEAQYRFNATGVGLTYFGLGFGNLLGLILFGAFSDRYLKYISLRRQPVPEDRLFPIYIGSLFVTTGLLWYGWSAHTKLHWIMPIIGTSIFGLGFVAFMMPIVVYLIDEWGLYAASAIAANVFLRSAVGACLPLASGKLYDRLGLGWGNTVLALIAVVTAPVPWVLHWRGRWLRERFLVKL